MAIFWASCGTLFMVPLWFVWHRVYADGIVGRAALLMISFSSATFPLEEMLDDDVHWDMQPQTVALVAAFAMFLVWHLMRFHRRVVREACGECERRVTCDEALE